MKTVWKYEIGLLTLSAIGMPVGAEIVSTGMQLGTVCFWALVNPRAQRETRSFRVYGTGHDVPNSCVYIGIAFDQPFVWHVFEEKE